MSKVSYLLDVFTKGTTVHCSRASRASGRNMISISTAPFSEERSAMKSMTNTTKESVRTSSSCESPGCSAAEDSVQFMTHLCHKYILFMAHMASFIYDLYSLNNEFIIYRRQVSGEVNSHYYCWVFAIRGRAGEDVVKAILP